MASSVAARAAGATHDHHPSYREVARWRDHQAYLPARLRLGPAPLPREHWWRWRDGEIHLDRYAADAAPATVVMLHGAGGYGRLLAPFGRLLHAAGYEVVAPDLPGWGLSLVPPSAVSHARWVDCVADLVAAEHARRARPVVLVGFSLGGFLAYLVAARVPVAGIAATALADPREPLVRAQFARRPWLGRVAPYALPWADRLCGGLRVPLRCVSNMEAIANDRGFVASLLADRCGAGNRASVHFLRTLFEARPEIEPEAFDRCPVLLAHPAADRWTTPEASRLLFDRLHAPKRLVMLERCGHFPIEEPGVTQLERALLEFLRAPPR